jgi:hypothetical protein
VRAITSSSLNPADDCDKYNSIDTEDMKLKEKKKENIRCFYSFTGEEDNSIVVDEVLKVPSQDFEPDIER